MWSNLLISGKASAENLCPALGTKFCIIYSLIENTREETNKEAWRNWSCLNWNTAQAKGV